jgi:hypothetical protein
MELYTLTTLARGCSLTVALTSAVGANRQRRRQRVKPQNGQREWSSVTLRPTPRRVRALRGGRPFWGDAMTYAEKLMDPR